ncbi:ATP-binding protein [Desulfotomaculum nigrificans]|uniref:ATP-binding protein n=1 Tax=Desulfotomaculum nigrificans TaxID=1565 RepID=UPI0001FAE82B|nr:ATP-binding protein [Desulfotomaculum nigrificans]
MSDFDRLVSVPHLNQSMLYAKWQEFINGEPVDTGTVFHETFAAWQRCKEMGINPYQIKDIVKLPERELARRRSRLQDIFSLLEPHFQTIERTVSAHSSTYTITVADCEGYILEVRSDQDTERNGLNFPFYPGVCVTERLVGNNGIGSVLQTGKPLAVIGAEHYVRTFHRWSCVGAPILDSYGNIAAVITISTPCGSESPYTFSLMVAVAKAVEAGLRQFLTERQLKDIRKTLSQLVQQRDVIFNDMSQGVIILNKDGVVTFFNAAAQRIWCIPPDEAGGKSIENLLKNCPRKESLLNKTIREGKPFTNIECKCRNHLHDKILLVNTSVLRDENNNINGAIGIFTDVTDLRRQEARIREQEKLAVVGQMAAGMAHEIRNPLTSVRGFAQLMKEKIGEQNNPFKEYVEIMIQEIDQADSFINNFLQLARPTPPKMQVCSVNDLIKNFVRIFENQAFLQGTKVLTDLREVPPLVIDSAQIKQVLLNLCQNALQALGQGGTLTLASSYQADTREIRVDVIDNGPGIPPEDLDKIGTPFYTTKDKGTGLGLSISYAIVDRHKGRVEVDSKVGQGTRFSIYLPVDKQF